jgi:Zn-dependent metalloprotease
VASALDGFAWERSGRIWYEALSDPEQPAGADFEQFARVTAATAGRLYGARSAERSAVVGGWRDVGVAAAPARKKKQPAVAR